MLRTLLVVLAAAVLVAFSVEEAKASTLVDELAEDDKLLSVTLQEDEEEGYVSIRFQNNHDYVVHLQSTIFNFDSDIDTMFEPFLSAYEHGTDNKATYDGLFMLLVTDQKGDKMIEGKYERDEFSPGQVRVVRVNVASNYQMYSGTKYQICMQKRHIRVIAKNHTVLYEHQIGDNTQCVCCVQSSRSFVDDPDSDSSDSYEVEADPERRLLQKGPDSTRIDPIVQD